MLFRFQFSFFLYRYMVENQFKKKIEIQLDFEGEKQLIQEYSRQTTTTAPSPYGIHLQVFKKHENFKYKMKTGGIIYDSLLNNILFNGSVCGFPRGTRLFFTHSTVELKLFRLLLDFFE